MNTEALPAPSAQAETELVPAGTGPDLEQMDRADAPAIWSGYLEKFTSLKASADSVLASDPSNPMSAKLARTARLEFRKARIEIESKRKELGETYLRKKKASAEREEVEKKAKAEREAVEAKAAVERAAREKLEREKRDREEAEAKRVRDVEKAAKKAAAAPDREKLAAFVLLLRGLPFPVLTTRNGVLVKADLEKRVESLAEWIEAEANEI